MVEVPLIIRSLTLLLSCSVCFSCSLGFFWLVFAIVDAITLLWKKKKYLYCCVLILLAFITPPKSRGNSVFVPKVSFIQIMSIKTIYIYIYYIKQIKILLLVSMNMHKMIFIYQYFPFHKIKNKRRS